MYIVNPLAANGETFSLFATHQPTAERIRILRSMAGASLADYEAAYKRTRGGALIGPASLQSAPGQSIRAPSAEGPIDSYRDVRDLSRRSLGYLRLRCNCGLEISVPEGYEQSTIRCVRCGSVLPIPFASPLPVTRGEGQGEGPPLSYTRTGRGWESFRCDCGRTIQLSPAFAAPFIRCNHCGRQINVTA